MGYARAAAAETSSTGDSACPVQPGRNLKTLLASWAIDHRSDALFVALENGHIVEMNTAAECILSRSTAMTIDQGRLVPTDAGEAKRLHALMAKADQLDAGGARLLVGRADQPSCHLITVFPPGNKVTADERKAVVVHVVDLLAPVLTGADIADLFGLSPAEDRLAQALVQGRTLQELTSDFGVRMPTLRSQMRSILRKCGVQRQVDLVRLLMRTQ